jgi:hypothetical protein
VTRADARAADRPRKSGNNKKQAMLSNGRGLGSGPTHTFRAETPGGRLRLRAGRPCPDLDRLLGASGADSWACVGAASALSRRITADAERARQQLIEQYVRGIGYTCYAAQDAGEGADPTLLILGISEDAAVRLGTMLDQPEVLVGRKGRCPELRPCGAANAARARRAG